MATPVEGMYYSDLPVDKVESITDDLKETVPSQVPFLNATGFFGSSEKPKNTIHYYYDDAYVPLRTTLSAQLTAAATAVTFTDDIFKSGQRIEIGGEVIVLGAKTGAGAFDITTRSLGTPAAALHANLTPALLVGRREDEGGAAGAADVSMEPRTVTTYPQEFERVVDVSDVMQALPRHARPGAPFDEKAALMRRDMIIEIENAGMWGVAMAFAPPAGGAFDGLMERVLGTNTTAMGGVDFNMASLRDAVEDIADFYDPDMDENAVLQCPVRQSFIFNDWEQAHVVVDQGDPLVQTYGIRVRRLRIGPMLIDVIPMTRMHNYAAMYQPKYIRWLHLIAPYFKKLADEGRNMRGIMSYCGLPEIYCPEAHYTFSGLQTA